MPKNDCSVIEIIKKPAGELITDAADLGVDEIMDRVVKDADILKDIPIIKWIFLGHQITNNLNLSFFIKKYAAFIGPVKKEIPDTFWNDENINGLLGSKGKLKILVEQTIVALDRYQAINKAEILGLLFVKTFKEKLFTIDEYNTLIFSVELMHPHLGVACLKQFYDYKLRMDATTDKNARDEIWLRGSKLDFSPLASTCLLRLPIGGAYVGSYGGAYLNDLGEKFYKEVVGLVSVA